MLTHHGHGLAVNFGKREPKSFFKDFKKDKTLSLVSFYFLTRNVALCRLRKSRFMCIHLQGFREATWNQIRWWREAQCKIRVAIKIHPRDCRDLEKEWAYRLCWVTKTFELLHECHLFPEINKLRVSHPLLAVTPSQTYSFGGSDPPWLARKEKA